MSKFTDEYKNILSIVSEEMEEFEAYFEKELFGSGTQISKILCDFFSKEGKKIRPALIFLFTKAMGFDVDENTYKLAFADEMIHNATLIHDDIIDCALARRGNTTINQQYDSKLAVLAGDYLLSLALKALSSFENGRIINIHTDSISNIVNGEISQYFERKKLISIEEYIEKSKNKTAELFKAGLASTAVLCDKNEKKISDFALNFGTAFQIHNDLADALKNDGGEDLRNGTYTAPWIYYFEEISHSRFDRESPAEPFNDLLSQGILNQVQNDSGFEESVHCDAKSLKNTSASEKTTYLITDYINRAIENINFLGDNQFKKSIIQLCNLFKG